MTRQALKPPFGDVLDMIGDTPMVEFRNLDCGNCRLFAKLESQNPGGSVKDRIGLSMVLGAEAEGRLQPGATLVEATAGNTGLGLALVAARKGYRLILVMPDKMSQEKVFHLRALGAEVMMTRSDVAKGHTEHYQEVAARLAAETPGAFDVNQFENPHNPRAHEEGTGPEIWEQMDHDLDAVVCGVGSGGTITGIGRFMKRVAPRVEMVLADPEGSVLAPFIESGELGEAGSWLVEGIGEDFIPPVCDLSLVAQAFTISDAESFLTARQVLLGEGALVGTSAGTLIAAAVRYCRQQERPKRVVTIVPDGGNKYLSKMFNDFWMLDQGFLERESFGDLRDLITRRHLEHTDYTVAPGDTLLTAYARMKLYDVSQLAVLDDDHIVGLVDESDILLAVYDREDYFKNPVAEAMTRNLETVAPTVPIETLLPIFERSLVALVVDGDEFLGLITRIDLLNYLRRRMK